MSDTLLSTLSTFFSDDKPEYKCLDCGFTDNLVVLFTSENGNQTWICKDCREKREEKSRGEITAKKAEIAQWAAMDAWEE